MPHFGFHAVYEHSFREAIELAFAYGFEYVQFDLNVPRFYIDRLTDDQLDEIGLIAADSGVRISFHAPGDNISLFTDYPAIRNGIIEHFKIILDKANRLDARHLTLHPLSPPSFIRADTVTDEFQEEYEAYFRDILIENLEHLERYSGNVMLCVENCRFVRSARAALDLIFASDSNIFLTLDYPKLHTPNIVPDPNHYSFFIKHKKRIRELHLHDMNSRMQSHLSPGQGILNFSDLLRDFYDNDTWLTIEVRPFSEALKARETYVKILGK